MMKENRFVETTICYHHDTFRVELFGEHSEFTETHTNCDHYGRFDFVFYVKKTHQGIHWFFSLEAL